MRKLLLVVCFIGCGLTLYGSQPLQQENKGLWSTLKSGAVSTWQYLNQNTALEDMPVSNFDPIKALRNARDQDERDVIKRQWETLLGNTDKATDGDLFTHKISILKRPGTLLTIALLFAAWHGTSMVTDIAKHYIMLPPLARESSLRSWSDTVKDFFIYEEKTMPQRSDVILNDYLKIRTEVLMQSVINAAANDTFLSHYLFYGPPGTGKTMLAKSIALESGFEYIIISGADLNQYSLEEGIKQIHHLFEFAKACPKKLMIVIDEADDLFAHREACSDKTRTFLNLILTYTGTEQSHFMVIALTNRVQAFDRAALSRLETVQIGAPELPERIQLFAQYAQKYLVDSHTINRDNRSMYQWLFSSKPKKRLPLYVAEDVFTTDEVFTQLGMQSEGLVGRDISHVMKTVQNAAYATHDQTITKDILYAALKVKKQELYELQQHLENAVPSMGSAASAA